MKVDLILPGIAGSSGLYKTAHSISFYTMFCCVKPVSQNMAQVDQQAFIPFRKLILMNTGFFVNGKPGFNSVCKVYTVVSRIRFFRDLYQFLLLGQITQKWLHQNISPASLAPHSFK